MTDNIFLLSTEEYEKYKDRIPHINCWWWLRSSGDLSNHVACVRTNGSVCNLGNYIDGDDALAVRPALKISDGKKHKIGERVVLYNFPWIIIDGGLAIAEVPIAFRRFDEESNDYENSEIKKFLLDWINEWR